MWNKTMQVFQARWMWLGLLVMVIFSGVWLQDAWRWNLRGVHFLKGEEEPSIIMMASCDHIWLRAAEAGRGRELSGQRQLWEKALGCSPSSISILQGLFHQDIDMARLATHLYPNNFQVWFWYGDAIAPNDAMGARQAYLHTIAIAPNYGLAWCRLGWSYQNDKEFTKAVEAFLNCCNHGDPGSNGCEGAGRNMENLGNPQKAIEYYRRSRSAGVLKRADELENQLKP